VAPRLRSVQVLKHLNGKSPYWYLRWLEPKSPGTGWKERWKSTQTTIKKDAEGQRRKLERELEAGRKNDDDPNWEKFVKFFVES
jgi:hypothetical protein